MAGLPTSAPRLASSCRKTEFIHHHSPEGVVYRSFCLSSGTFADSETASRRWWCIESLFPSCTAYRQSSAASEAGTSRKTLLELSPERRTWGFAALLALFVLTIYIYIYTHNYIQMCIYILHMCRCIYIYIYMHMCICIYTHTYIYIYIYTHTHIMCM